VDEFIKYVLDEAITPLSAGVILIAVTGIAILQRSYLREIALLRKENENPGLPTGGASRDTAPLEGE
jgi:hypothetical protein